MLSGKRWSWLARAKRAEGEASEAPAAEFPFADPLDVAVITLRRILAGAAPILYVSHDADDGGWQFLDGGEITEEEAAVAGLDEVWRADPSIGALADLPLGWYAFRQTRDSPWQRAQHTD